ncbi:MAG: hypothetical protein JST55_16755 [Bacteroidetes bacterium]|nr:hypothetical protein [Bacteroidota bacterium]
MSFIGDLKQNMFSNLKNIVGWKTKRKIVVFSVDDYGNVRVDSKAARENMDKAGLKVLSIFDAYDTLETSEDLEILYNTLSSVKDKHGNPAIFTPFAVPCNINYEKMAENNFESYYYELLPETFSKLKNYANAWNLWKEGIADGLMEPQFHGREHMNLKVFEDKLKKKDHEVLTALKNRSYTSISGSGYATISYTAAFEFWDFKENERFDGIIKDGLNNFEKVFGYPSTHFNAPGGAEHPVIHKSLSEKGVKYLDAAFIKREHRDREKFKRVFNYTGKRNDLNQMFMVRNVVFEPSYQTGIDWVNFTMKQIESAFRWNKPAVISSHRVNFCGYISEDNRKLGINRLGELLKKITQRWPDVEFMSANKLGDLIYQDR